MSNAVSAAAPHGSIGQYAFSSAKQATAVKESLANAANSDAQKSNDAALEKLKNAASSQAPVYSSAPTTTSASAAVTAQNVNNQPKASADAPHGSIGSHAFVSAKQAAAVKEALGKAGSSSAQLGNDSVVAQLKNAAGAGTQTATSNQAAAAANPAQNDNNAAKALQTLAKVTAAYRSYNNS